jgi:hypothetical protein
MKKISKQMIVAACAISGLACAFGAFVIGLISAAKLGISLAFALVTIRGEDADEGVRANVRKWHGSMDDQYDNIDNLVRIIKAHPKWEMVPDMSSELEAYRDKLKDIMGKCNSSSASSDDRHARNSLLKGVVGYCLKDVKIWAYSQYVEGDISKDDLHGMRFLLPGETGGYHARGDATKELPMAKLSIINMDNVQVILDQSNEENAALVHHGWPKGIRQAVIQILSADGKTEVVNQMTSRLYTDIEMPAGSHGKMFILKAAFLKHLNDKPRYSYPVTFSMPQTVEDLNAVLDRQHHEAFEAQVRAVEDHRRDVERLDREEKERLGK